MKIDVISPSDLRGRVSQELDRLDLDPRHIITLVHYDNPGFFDDIRESPDAVVIVTDDPFDKGNINYASSERIRLEAEKIVRVINYGGRGCPVLLIDVRDLARTVSDSTRGVLTSPMPSESMLIRRSPLGALLSRMYLDPLLRMATGTPSVKIVLPRECFYNGDAPGEPLPQLIEMAGRPRILCYGPYLPLPKGTWELRACLGFSAETAKMPFILEADTTRDIFRGYFEVPNGGLFTTTLDVCVEISSAVLEIRLISQESALEGQCSLLDVELSLLAE